MYSSEYKMYIKKLKIRKLLVIITQILILAILLFLWEYLSINEVINSFIYSSPSRVFTTIINLANDNNLFNHIWITVYETFVSFSLATLL